MRRMLCAALAAAVLSSCSPGQLSSPTESPTSTVAAVEEHESGPQSPIGFGLYVPQEATQLGPLLRYRTARIIAAFEPELRAALTRQALTDARRDARGNDSGLPSETPPTAPPVSRPRPDTFSLLDAPPEPDTTVSFMRIDGTPTEAVRTMVAEIAGIFPDDAIDPNDMRSYCAFEGNVVQGCHLEERGRTPTGAELAVTMTVDVGADGTAPAGSLGRPVMTVFITNLGDPTADRPDDVDLDLDGVLTDLKTRPSWPTHKQTTPSDAPIVGTWILPDDATLMLSGGAPRFAAAVTRTGNEADGLARSFAAAAGSDVQRDVVEELNEIRTTYIATADDGSQFVGSFVVTARGSYVLLMRLPKGGWR